MTQHDPTTRPLLRDALGGVLRRIRLQQGRTLANVARAARVSTPYLSELERGRKEASSEVVAAVCNALGVDLADVMPAVGHALVAARTRRAELMRIEAVRSHRSTAPRAHAEGLCLAA
ncbi:MAG TPA: helix-turn-helix domain-containing protein [Candidatus Stackebrandtia excrementipullorum]|nr:helix-turn-helix domain-containing protein [Candidatus Stackebrandtia excrementipullorum]